MNERFNRAAQLHKEGKSREAILELQKAIHEDPNDTRLYVTLGALFELDGRNEEAIKTYRTALRINMDDASANFRLGLLFNHMRRFNDALMPLRMAWSNDQKNAKIANALARALDETEDFDTAQVMYEAAIRLDPGLFGAHFNLATLRFNDQKYESAIAHYVDYMIAAGESSRVHRNIGMALVQLGEPDSALSSFNRALALDPTDATIYYNIALVYDENGDFEKTRKNLQSAVDLDPHFHEARYELAKLLKNNGHHQESIAEFKRLIGKCPDHYRALNGLATCYLSMKDADSAVDLLRDAIKVFPNCARTHYNLGVALRSIGNAEESRVHLLAANDIDPSYGTSHRVLGPRMSRPIRKLSLSQRIGHKANAVHAGR